MNSKEKGNIALGNCIKFATSKGYIVALPLNDAQDYDIVIDNGSLLKVQIKYTGTQSSSGKYIVDTRVRGHINAEGEYYIKKSVSPVDYFFITTEDGVNYFIPSDFVEGNLTFTLSESFNDFLV